LLKKLSENVRPTSGEGPPTQLDGTTNFVGRATYFLWNLSANQSKTVKVVYRRL
jgi:hypothetical protein